MNPKDLVGAKKAPLRYVPPAGAIESSGPHEDGAIKYGPFNWRETPVEMVTYLEAIDRHLAALKDGQDVAEDSGYSHIGHIIAGANIIADAKAHGTLIDNRFAKGPAADMLRARDKSAKANAPLRPAGASMEYVPLQFNCLFIGSNGWRCPATESEHDGSWALGHPFERVSITPECHCVPPEHRLDCPRWVV